MSRIQGSQERALLQHEQLSPLAPSASLSELAAPGSDAAKGSSSAIALVESLFIDRSHLAVRLSVDSDKGALNVEIERSSISGDDLYLHIHFDTDKGRKTNGYRISRSADEIIEQGPGRPERLRLSEFGYADARAVLETAARLR